MNEALITLDNLSVGYNGRPVVSGISLSVTPDCFTAILGANGSGKSTLLKTLIGLLPPVSGRIETAASMGGLPVFGYVPQAGRFDPIYPLTGFDVVLMGVYGRVRPGRFIPKAERAFARECLRATSAEDFARMPFAQLSGGQKQRVLIARALATRPRILALDEPTAGVDATATRTVLEFIARIREERKLAVLLVTHDFAAARRHARQVLWLYQGKARHGTVDELLTSERMAEILEMGIV